MRRAATLAFGVAAGVSALVWWRRTYYALEVAGSSMSPALEAGDFLLMRRTRPPHGERAAGLVVHARGPGERPLLKRIVGLPGESLRVGDAVWINQRRLLEPYTHGVAPPAQWRGVHVLGPDEYFLLGDRRDASTDSRDFGPLPATAVDGVALLRYWPPRRLALLRRPPRRFALEQ